MERKTEGEKEKREGEGDGDGDGDGNGEEDGDKDKGIGGGGRHQISPRVYELSVRSRCTTLTRVTCGTVLSSHLSVRFQERPAPLHHRPCLFLEVPVSGIDHRREGDEVVRVEVVVRPGIPAPRTRDRRGNLCNPFTRHHLVMGVLRRL